MSFLDNIYTEGVGYEFNVPYGAHLDTQLDSFLAPGVFSGIEFIMEVEAVFGVDLGNILGLMDSKLRAMTMGDVMQRVIAARERIANTNSYQHPLDQFPEDNDFSDEPQPTQTVTITQEEYAQLLADSATLAQLRAIINP